MVTPMLIASVSTPKSRAISGSAVTMMTLSSICMKNEAATTSATLRACGEKLLMALDASAAVEETRPRAAAID